MQDDPAARMAFFHELADMTNPKKHYRHRTEQTFNRIILSETDREERVRVVGEEVARLMGKKETDYKIRP